MYRAAVLMLTLVTWLPPVWAQGTGEGTDPQLPDAPVQVPAEPPTELAPSKPDAGPASLLDLPAAKVLGLTERAPYVPIPDRRAMRASLDKGLDYLLSAQEEDGAWGSWREPQHGFWSNPHTHRAWIAATTGLVVSALLEARQDEPALVAADRGLQFLVGTFPLKRPSDWDTDHTWGFVYALAGVNVALGHPRYASGELRAQLLDLARQCVVGLASTQSPDGGWGYYDDEVTTQRPSWSTSFQTAVALVELVGATAHGVTVDPKLLAAGRRALERCRLPSGAYTYSVDAVPSPGGATYINRTQGSLCRIQVCNLALVLTGSTLVGQDELRTGLDELLQHHRFLDVARGKPIPHEAYYYNSGYFYFFGHYYAARVLELLPPADQVVWRGRLAREVVKCQEADGSMWDYAFNTYHRSYGTAFGAMTLLRTLGREGN